MADESTSDVLFTLPIHGTAGSTGSLVCTEPKTQVYLLTFTSPPDNRLVSGFCNAFILALDILEHRHRRGVVVSTSGVPKFYSNGMDIEHSQFTRMYMPGVLYKLWRRLLTYSMPTVALVNGHAFAGGAMVAMMHDYRVMNPHKGYFSLNELELGMPLTPPMTAIFRMKLNAGVVRKMILEAYRFKALEALKEGIVDHLGEVNETLAFVEELQLVKKAQPGFSGRAIYGELKTELWRETVEHLDNWAEQHVRDFKMRDAAKNASGESLKRVEQWERMKAKL